MPHQRTREAPPHVHGAGCGHPRVRHEGHVDFLQDGHLQHPTGKGGVEEHSLGITKENPERCTKGHACQGHGPDHTHGPGCGHPAVPHGNHVDYLVAGHLHHPHHGHCDNHGDLPTS